MPPYITTSYYDYIQPTDTVVIAVSGGVDSMVLLYYILSVHSRQHIVVAHFDHSLRGIESDMDRQLVESFCNKENIRYEMKKMDIWHIASTEKSSIEAVARRERYIFLRYVLSLYAGTYILTAHHADDQIETILLGILKGWKVHGLCGMSQVSGSIYRPFLHIPKGDIYTIAKNRNIPYREDKTNTDTHYQRNMLRQQVLPILQGINPAVHTTFGELGQYMQDMSQYMQVQVQQWLAQSQVPDKKPREDIHTEKIPNENSTTSHQSLVPSYHFPYTFYRTSLLSQSIFFQREIVTYMYRTAHGGSSQGLSRGVIAEVLRYMAEDSSTYGEKHIHSLHLVRRGERVIWSM